MQNNSADRILKYSDTGRTVYRQYFKPRATQNLKKKKFFRLFFKCYFYIPSIQVYMYMFMYLLAVFKFNSRKGWEPSSVRSAIVDKEVVCHFSDIKPFLLRRAFFKGLFCPTKQFRSVVVFVLVFRLLFWTTTCMSARVDICQRYARYVFI